MEYVQVALFQITSDRVDDASGGGGLFEALDEHRGYLEHQPGFQDMRVVRSINEQGNVQIVVETRWDDPDALVRYETSQPNVEAVIRSHDEAIVTDSLQIFDMEALRADSPREPAAAVARERILLPLAVPLGIVMFGILVVYGLSRIYLELRPVEIGDLSITTPLSLGVAAGILLLAWYFASRPVPAWQVGGIVVLAGGLLLGGSIAAAVHEEGGAEEDHNGAVTEPSPGPGGPGAEPGGLAFEVGMGDNFFVSDGNQNPNIDVPSGQEITIDLVNDGRSIHNMRVDGVDGRFNTNDDAVSDPETIRVDANGTLTFSIDNPGTYNYQCDFHPDDMKGTITVQ